MAIEYGEVAKFPASRAATAAATLAVLALLLEAVLGFCLGLQVSHWNQWKFGMGLLVVSATIGVIAYFGFRHLVRKWDRYREGAFGEARVAMVLRHLSDDYHVFHGLELPHGGDIDHLVVGPAGVFCVDAKYWTGRNTATADSELARNGRALDKPHVKRFSASVMRVRDMLGENQPDGVYFQPLFVFVDSSRIDANFGTTDPVHCLRLERLMPYLQNNHPSRKPIAPDRVRHLAARVKVLTGNP